MTPGQPCNSTWTDSTLADLQAALAAGRGIVLVSNDPDYAAETQRLVSMLAMPAAGSA